MAKQQQATQTGGPWTKRVAQDLLVIDGDGHILETEEGFEKFIDPEFKAQCPRVVKPFADSKTLQKLPSEYARSDQLYFSADPDEEMLPAALEYLGEDRITYASDYPHHDAKFPNSVRMVLENSKLPEPAKRKILGENAARLYKLSLDEVRQRLTA